MNNPGAAGGTMRILLTGVGCPGAHALITSLKRQSPELWISGTDASRQAIGRWLCDDFAQVPWAHDEGYVDAIVELAQRWEVEVVFPQTSWEMFELSKAVDRFEGVATLLASPHEWVAACEDKFAMYEALKGKMELPRYELVHTLAELEAAAARLGFPERDVVFKPPRGKGSRGVRVLTERGKRYELLFEGRPFARYISLQELRTTVGEREIPPLLVMEYLEGEEHKIDPIARGGEVLLGTVKRRLNYASGLAMGFEMIEAPELLAYGAEVLHHIPLDWCVDISTRGGVLMEINPRVSTFIYGEVWCPPWLALQLATGRISADEVRARQPDAPVGTRMFRYYCQQEF